MDGFRALAVLWLFLLHIWLAGGKAPLDDGFLRAVISQGYIGVDVLFIVSGFVLFLPAVLNHGRIGSVRSYALRRAARLVPAYYAFLVIGIALHRWIAPSLPVVMPWTSWAALWGLVSHLLFIHMYALAALPGFGLIPGAWTLTLEATFYVVLPLITRTFYRRPLVCLVTALAVSELWQWALVHATHMKPSDFVSFKIVGLVCSFPTYMGHFALGMAGASLYVRAKEAAGQRLWRITLPFVQLATAGALIAFLLQRSAIADPRTFYVVERMETGYVAVLLTAFMLATALAPRWTQAPFRNGFVYGLGDASYGIYLAQSLLLGAATAAFKIPADASNAVFYQLAFFTIPPAMAVGWLSCRFVEQPLREWARRRTPRPSPVPTFPPPDLVPATLGGDSPLRRQ